MLTYYLESYKYAKNGHPQWGVRIVRNGVLVETVQDQCRAKLLRIRNDLAGKLSEQSDSVSANPIPE